MKKMSDNLSTAYRQGYTKVASLVYGQQPDIAQLRQMYQNALINHDTQSGGQFAGMFTNPRRFRPNETLVSYRRGAGSMIASPDRSKFRRLNTWGSMGQMTPEMRRRAVMM